MNRIKHAISPCRKVNVPKHVVFVNRFPAEEELKWFLSPSPQDKDRLTIIFDDTLIEEETVFCGEETKKS